MTTLLELRENLKNFYKYFEKHKKTTTLFVVAIFLITLFVFSIACYIVTVKKNFAFLITTSKYEP